jgi:hypothetical protein
MSASIIASLATADELDELDARPMTDTEHRAVFGWGWDDPDKVEEAS